MPTTIRLAIPYLLLALVPAALAAAPGTGMLALDRHALTSILAAEMPPPVKVQLQPLGTVTVRFSAPDTVQFVQGGVEARIGVEVIEAAINAAATFRFWPEVDTAKGVIRLKPMRAVGEGPLSILPDMAGLMQPIELPRVFNFVLAGQGAGETPVTVNVKDVSVRNERLEIGFGIDAAPKPAPARGR